MRTLTRAPRRAHGVTPASERTQELRRSLAWLGALGAAYAMAIALLGVGGGSPGSTPWLALPRESYFLLESLFVAPVIVASALLASTTVYLLSCMRGSSGSFDDTLVAVTRATCIATLFSLIPDLFMGVTTAIGMLDGAALAADLVRPSAWRVFLWAYLALYAAAFLLLYPRAVRSAHPSLSTRAAVAIGWTAFLVYQGVMLVFVR